MPSSVVEWIGAQGDKLAKLIRMLGSDQDGEVVAAARAIQRTLASEGLDLHDLADALLHVPMRARLDMRKTRAATVRQSAGSDDPFRNIWIVSCDGCLQHANKLSRAEYAFVKNFQRDLTAERPYTRARMKRLMKICSRLGI